MPINLNKLFRDDSVDRFRNQTRKSSTFQIYRKESATIDLDGEHGYTNTNVQAKLWAKR